MNPTEFTLLEQMRITEFDLEYRKQLLNISDADLDHIMLFKTNIENSVDDIVEEFYKIQTGIPEISLLIGDAETLNRLKSAQRRYISDLFCGNYDLSYVNNRLRIGLVHKRIGVEPKLYLSAILQLRGLLFQALNTLSESSHDIALTKAALDKLLFFDITLVFETYTRSLITELESAKNKAEHYARDLEKQMHERTELMKTDPLTGVFNRHGFIETLKRILNSAQRRREPVSLLFIDVNKFKEINDRNGHQHGDTVLVMLGRVLNTLTRSEDACFRLGGDEFCVVLSNITEEKAIAAFSQRVRHLIAGQMPEVSVSIGVSQTGPEHYVNPDVLLKIADERMYADKANKKPKMHQRVDTLSVNTQSDSVVSQIRSRELK